MMKNCVVCKAPFDSITTWQIYCSANCSHEVVKARLKAERLAKKEAKKNSQSALTSDEKAV